MSLDGAYIALKGYCFQFDKTILELFKNSDKEISIEQVQDFGFDDFIIQVKHHDTEYSEAQRSSKLKKPLLQLLNEFLLNDSKKFVLYIYFKGVHPTNVKINISELDAILGIDASRFDKRIKTGFVNSFILSYAENFEILHSEVISQIKSIYNRNKEEAELYYLIISSYLLGIVIKYPPDQKEKRKSTKKQIDELLNKNKKIVFNSSYSEILGKDRYHKLLHKQYFNTGLNRHPFDRFFIIEIVSSYNISTLKELVLNIKLKWSKNKTKTIPDNDRFAPYIYFRGLNPDHLILLKQQLHNEGFVIKDGFDFLGASFSIKSISEPPSFYNQIFFRLLNEDNLVKQTLNWLSKTKEVYQFYFAEPMPFDVDVKHIKVEIKDLNDIVNII